MKSVFYEMMQSQRSTKLIKRLTEHLLDENANYSETVEVFTPWNELFNRETFIGKKFPFETYVPIELIQKQN